MFTANMTGNVVLLGFGLAHASGLPVLAPLISLGAFLLGAGAGGLLSSAVQAGYRRTLLIALVSEVALLAIAGTVALAIAVRVGSGVAYAIVAVVALAMGVRNAIVRRLAVADMTTTVLTMTLTGLAADSAGAQRDPRRLLRRAGVVVAMLTGGLIGALLQKWSIAAPLFTAAALAAGATSAYALNSLAPRRPA